MENKDDNILNDDNFSVSSLSEYTNAITSIRNSIIEEGKSETLFFRGQSNKSWDIRPSIFRDSLISVEHKIIQTAIARVPQEFRECSSEFEELTKLQHYGLPTRLLDITMNPLVALYFACLPTSKVKDEDGNEVDPDGIVYICTGYAEHEISYKTEILSKITKIGFERDFTLKDLKAKLEINKNIDPESFIKQIQETIFVMPSYSNSRLIRQSGAFLISGAINVTVNEHDLWNCKVSKSVKNLNQEVDKKHIIIPQESKEKLLDELDFFNINESTLFPELEHQMSHIKKVGAKWVTTESPSFVKYESETSVSHPVTENVTKKIGEEEINKIFNKLSIPKANRPALLNVILEIQRYPDWNRKENTYNELIKNLKHIIKGFDKNRSKTLATQIAEKLNSISQ